jgi:hypothetical protein
MGQPRRSDETSGMSALRLIAARCCITVAGAPVNSINDKLNDPAFRTTNNSGLGEQ